MGGEGTQAIKQKVSSETQKGSHIFEFLTMENGQLLNQKLYFFGKFSYCKFKAWIFQYLDQIQH
jgi:hypothetical protein